jgi:MYXO-CTERM domain-containing protein
MAPGSYYGFPTLGISQNGSPGKYSYSVTGTYSQAANCPIFDMTWGDAARFCNWLQNGQPRRAEGNGTTETGAYTLNGTATNWMAVTRNSTATYFIPSENEWYKAAYYDPTLNGGAGGYWIYPTKSNTPPSNVVSRTGTNNANYYISGYTDPTNYLTPVGSFVSSRGPYGTYDMGGDVLQWTEADITSLCRGLRGGAFDKPGFSVYYPSSYDLASYNRDYYNYPNSENNPDVGFRVASLVTPTPEPSSLVALSGLGAVGLLPAWRRRKRTAA